MDGVAVMYASDSALQEFGRKAKGDLYASKAFCQKKIKPPSNFIMGIGLKVAGYVVHLFLKDDQLLIYTVHLYLYMQCTSY